MTSPNESPNSDNKTLKIFFQERVDAIKEWHPPRWAKITAVALLALVGFTCFATALVGALALLGVHVGALASLNSAITSIWKGLPYLMTAMGGPGVLIALVLMIYVVYTGIKAIQEHRKKQGPNQGGGVVPAGPFSSMPQNQVTISSMPQNQVTIQGQQYSLISSPLIDIWFHAGEQLLKASKPSIYLFLNSEEYRDQNGLFIPENHYIAVYFDDEGKQACKEADNIVNLMQKFPKIDTVQILTN